MLKFKVEIKQKWKQKRIELALISGLDCYWDNVSPSQFIKQIAIELNSHDDRN
jgi:hypothetical protein